MHNGAENRDELRCIFTTLIRRNIGAGPPRSLVTSRAIEQRRRRINAMVRIVNAASRPNYRRRKPLPVPQTLATAVNIVVGVRLRRAVMKLRLFQLYQL